MSPSTFALPRLWYLYLFLIPLLSLRIQFIHHYWLSHNFWFWRTYYDTHVPSGIMSDSSNPIMDSSSPKIQRTPVYFLGIGGPNLFDNTGKYEIYNSSLMTSPDTRYWEDN